MSSESTIIIDLDAVPIEPKSSILKDQDFQQKLGMTATVAAELYRVVAASFLILFVPQLCDDLAPWLCQVNGSRPKAPFPA